MCIRDSTGIAFLKDSIILAAVPVDQTDGVFEFTEACFLAPAPVSYTHLDVYKRQQKHRGKGTTIKHFAVNNQEDNRYFVNAHVSLSLIHILRKISDRTFQSLVC